MKRETTMCIGRDDYEKLAGAARMAKMSMSGIIALLLKRLMCEPGGLRRGFGTITYRPRSDGRELRRLHVVFYNRDHGFFQDLRKFRRVSVSFLVSVAIKKYLAQLLGKIKKDYDEFTDNYPFQNYVICKKSMGKVVCWLIYWGIPAPPHRITN